MADDKVTIDFSFDRGGPVTITGDKLTIDLTEAKIVDGPAAALAGAIANDIRASGKWDKTGTLLRGVAAARDGSSYSVVVPSDRLNTPELEERFAEDIDAARDPLGQSEVLAALEKAMDEVFR